MSFKMQKPWTRDWRNPIWHQTSSKRLKERLVRCTRVIRPTWPLSEMLQKKKIRGSVVIHATPDMRDLRCHESLPARTRIPISVRLYAAKCVEISLHPSKYWKSASRCSCTHLYSLLIIDIEYKDFSCKLSDSLLELWKRILDQRTRGIHTW